MGLSPGATLLLAGLLAAVVTTVVTPLVRVLARRTGVMDHPGALKPHAAPVPYLGGVAVLVGALSGLVGFPHPAAVVPLAGALLLGLVDDIRTLGVLPRIATEVAVGAAVVWSVGLGVSLAGGAVLLGTIVMINAVNFVDGIDALAAGVCAVSFVGFAVVLPTDWARLAAVLAGGALGFLLFNRPPARIYLGDAGSYLLGTALAVLAGASLADSPGHSAGNAAAVSPDGLFGTGITATAAVTVIALMGYPVVEVVSTIVRRLASRRPLLAGDRDHVYDQLVLHGLTGPRTAAVLIGAQVAVVGTTILGHELDAVVITMAAAVLIVISIVVAAIPRTPAVT